MTVISQGGWTAVRRLVLASLAAITLSSPMAARADQLIQQGSKLTPNPSSSGAEFGVTVAMSADGGTALVGSAQGTDVLTRSGPIWVQQTTLPAGEGIALSADGMTAMVSTAEGTYVYRRRSATWSEQATLVAGASGALSRDGKVALIGTPTANGHAGAAWVYTRRGSSWHRQAELASSEVAAEAEFGYSVALSGDGETALVGAPGGLGAAFIFARSGSHWSEQGGAIAGFDKGTRIYHGEFGTAVALSADGSTALIGGEDRVGAIEPFTPEVGAAWALTRSGSAWTAPATELSGEDDGVEINRGRGRSFSPCVAPRPPACETVALSGDGHTALIGGDLDTGLGAAWLFTRTGATWDEQGTELQGGGQVGSFGGLFGAGVALSATGNTALVGDPHDNGNTGAAWFFASSPTVTGLEPMAGRAWGGTRVTITGANLAGATAVMFGSVPATSFTVESPDTITAVSPPGSGQANVTVTTPQGTSPSGSANLFSYGLAVTGVSPDSGSPLGGTPVSITGSGFRHVRAVWFGSVPAVEFTVRSDDSITAVAPPGSGTVSVTADVRRESAPAGAGALFSYASLRSFPTGMLSGTLGQIISGPGGDLWFTESTTGIGRITPEGAVDDFPGIRDGGVIAAGSEGLVWFRESPYGLGRLSPEGTERPVFVQLSTENPEALALGPKSDVWSSDYSAKDESGQILAITPQGQVAFSSGLPETHRGGVVPLMAGGPDNDLWFAWDHTGIVRLVPGGATRQYAVGAGVAAITVDDEDNLWFADPSANEIARLTPEGVITGFSYGIVGEPAAITAGPEGDIWFTEPAAHAIGRITSEGAVTQFSEGIGSAPVGITAGPEGDIWFTEESGEIGRLTP